MWIPALDRKLLRDLSQLKGQVATIALVVACGIASFVTLRSAYDSLVYSQAAYYERHRFADVFAHLDRAPLATTAALEAIPGVARVESRVVESVTIPLPGASRPATGVLVSLPEEGTASLNAVHLAAGRLPDRAHPNEALVLEAYAEAHRLQPGDHLDVVIDGASRRLTLTGFAMSPEYVFVIPPGAMSHDPKQAAVFWMPRTSAAAAFRMEGAFNDVVLDLQPGAAEADVLDAVDRILEPFGGRGAVPRAKQPSHYMLSSELGQLRGMAQFVPFLFLFVAAFLLNVVLTRLIFLQRGQIATLKAIGYGDRQVGLHYLKLVSVVVLLGAALGVLAGAWLGRMMTDLYTGRFFRFPDPHYRLEVDVWATSVGISLASALAGALGAVRSVVRLPPAEAMLPPAPARYRRSVLERLGLAALVGPAARMVVREIEKRPGRLLLSSLGISLAVGIVVVAGYWSDAIDYMLDVQFHGAMREDVTITFAKPLSPRAVRDLRGLPGVWHAEGLTVIAARIRAGHRERDCPIVAHPRDGELRHILDGEGRRIPLPPAGVVLTAKLAEVLQVGVGDTVRIELREGGREARDVTVTGLADEPFGMQGHLERDVLTSLTGETPAVNNALLRIDPAEQDRLTQRLKEMPWILSVSYPGTFRAQFERQSGDFIRVYTLILTLFAGIIAVGVVYNNARIALSQRTRDLASLRVLGFTRREIASILLGEMSAQVILALPLGLYVGYLLVRLLGSTVDEETYRLPMFVSPRSYAFAFGVILSAALASFLLVRRKLDRLDLVGVLKTRD